MSNETSRDDAETSRKRRPDWSYRFGAPGDHSPEVNSTAISANGRVLLAGSGKWAGYGHFESRIWRRSSDGTVHERSCRISWFGDKPSFQGVYWVALSADGSVGAIAGYTRSKNHGCVQIVHIDGTGSEITARLVESVDTPGGVEEVRISDDGATIAWVAQHSYGAAHYDYHADGGTWEHRIVENDVYCRSLAMSADGRRLIIGCKNSVRHVKIEDGCRLHEVGRHDTGKPDGTSITNEALEVACTPNFDHVAASLGDGRLLYWHRPGAASDFEPTWRTTTAELGGELSSTGYALTLHQQDAGALILWGTNQTPYSPAKSHGWINRISVEDGSDPRLAGYTLLTWCPNPGLVTNGTDIGACDGQPFTHGPHKGESTTGHFYCLDEQGRKKWSYQTNKMNWGLSMANDGTMFGGSDTGEVLLWQPED